MKNTRRSGALVGALLLTLNLLSAALAASVPRPEHPRPDLFRENWITLNGEWQFEIDSAGDGEARGLKSGKDLESKINVPFCPESQLSGIGHYGPMKNVWYRRHFDVPATMKGKRVLTSLYLDPPVHVALKKLSEATRVPIAVYLREAISDLLVKYDVKVTRGRKA